MTTSTTIEKKTKVKKAVDYSRVPQPVWDKEWSEVEASMRDIEVSLNALSNGINNLEKLNELEPVC